MNLRTDARGVPIAKRAAILPSRFEKIDEGLHTPSNASLFRIEPCVKRMADTPEQSKVCTGSFVSIETVVFRVSIVVDAEDNATIDQHLGAVGGLLLG